MENHITYTYIFSGLAIFLIIVFFANTLMSTISDYLEVKEKERMREELEKFRKKQENMVKVKGKFNL